MTSNYAKLGIALSINAIVMFFLTYAQIAELGHLYVNINRMYMALMMVAPMALVMLFVMRSMYENATLKSNRKRKRSRR